MTIAKVLELVGKSELSWEHAAQSAVEEAAKTVRHITAVYVKDLSANVEKGKITAYKAVVKLTFVVEA